MKLLLVDRNIGMCDAWKKHFIDLPSVEIIHSQFEEIKEFDCIVSPANSFGLMDGGIDLAIINFFGVQLMQRVQQKIIKEYLGEQPVGTSMIVETKHEKHPYLAHTPTMRVPMDIRNTDYPYLAMWAMLRTVYHHNASQSEPKINSVLCSGLGTATGRVPFVQAARQMSLAYKNYLRVPNYIDWNYASGRQNDIRFGGLDGFNFPADWD